MRLGRNICAYHASLEIGDRNLEVILDDYHSPEEVLRKLALGLRAIGREVATAGDLVVQLQKLDSWGRQRLEALGISGLKVRAGELASTCHPPAGQFDKGRVV